MKKDKKEKKGFFKEFKEFISRGNVFDLAVGVIIGGAFTAIVNALCNNILKPIINWVLALIVGKNGLDGIYTYLGKPVYTTNEAGEQIIDLANSIYIDWGAFINAVINFLLIALVLFLIIKVMMSIKRAGEEAKAKIEEKAAERAAKEAEEAAKKEAELNSTVPAQAPADAAEANTEAPAKEEKTSEEPKEE